MIPVKKPAKAPKGFAARCAKPGAAWLSTNPLDASGKGREPRDYWTQFEPDLRKVFSGRCGWLAMWIPDGQVDHYLSKHHPDPVRRAAQRPLAYRWSNLRYASASVNRAKGNLDNKVLDPYLVGAGWFALKPSLKLKVTNGCPRNERARARFTAVELKLVDGKVAMRLREEYLRQYDLAVTEGMSQPAALDELARKAPLIADYVRSTLPPPPPPAPASTP